MLGSTGKQPNRLGHVNLSLRLLKSRLGICVYISIYIKLYAYRCTCTYTSLPMIYVYAYTWSLRQTESIEQCMSICHSIKVMLEMCISELIYEVEIYKASKWTTETVQQGLSPCQSPRNTTKRPWIKRRSHTSKSMRRKLHEVYIMGISLVSSIVNIAYSERSARESITLSD